MYDIVSVFADKGITNGSYGLWMDYILRRILVRVGNVGTTTRICQYIWPKIHSPSTVRSPC